MEHFTVNNTPVFEVHNLCYAYNEQISALNSIDLIVHPGEKLAVLGSNGSGKSTLLKILDGLYFPTGGSISAFGKDLSEAALRDERYNYEFRSQVGFVFQDSDAQLFMPSVWDEVAFAPLQLGFTPEQVTARVESSLAALRIEKLRDRAPHQLSGGEKKRVALASILSLSPKVWLLDEPSAGLDPRSVAWLVEFLNNQAEDRKTVVLATHDLELVKSTADRVYVLDESHTIVAEDTPDQILANRDLLISANLAR
jgi:cobalt/nickel transport system ATP-binding protein